MSPALWGERLKEVFADGDHLFARHGIALPHACVAFRSSLPPRDDQRPRLWNVTPFAATPRFGIVEQQLHFTWTEAASAKVVSLVEHRGSRYLDFGVYDFLRDVPDAARAARGLERAGICLIGQLVQLRTADLPILKCMSDPATIAIRDNLQSIGLSFDMYLPLWNRRAGMPIVL